MVVEDRVNECGPDLGTVVPFRGAFGAFAGFRSPCRRPVSLAAPLRDIAEALRIDLDRRPWPVVFVPADDLACVLVHLFRLVQPTPDQDRMDRPH